eukprot:scaffold1793_cov164-Ochromonas_danica.AAC.3
MDIVIDRDFMLSLLCSRYHLQVRDVLIKKYEVNEARKCQSGYGFLFIDRLEDAKIVIKNLQGLCLEGINFDCQLSNRSLEKINAVRRAAGLDEEGRREGEAEQRGSRGPEDGSSLPPSTTRSGRSPSNSRRDLSSSSTSTIYASTSSEEYSSYDSHDSHSRFIENRSYGTASAPTMSLRHLVQETLAPARYYSSHASSAVSAASLQPAIPYYHGSLPRRFQAAGPSTASTMISASLPTAAGMVAAALPSNGMRPNLLRVGTVAPTPASQQMMMMMPQTMAVNGLQVVDIVSNCPEEQKCPGIGSFHSSSVTDLESFLYSSSIMEDHVIWFHGVHLSLPLVSQRSVTRIAAGSCAVYLVVVFCCVMLSCDSL